MCVNMSSVQFLQSQDEDLGEFCNNNYIFCKNAGKCPHDWFIDYVEQRRGSQAEVEEATS